MVEITLKDSGNFNVLDILAYLYKICGIKLMISNNKIKVFSQLPDFVWKYISSIGDICVINDAKRNELTQNFKQEILEGSLWMVNLGEPVDEFDIKMRYSHPCYVLKNVSRSKFLVIPLTSKFRFGSVVQFKVNEKTLSNANTEFMENSKSRISYVICNESREIHAKHFETFLGNLSQDIIDEILLTRGEIQFKSFENESKTLDDIHLTDKQKFIISGFADKAMEIANRYDLTYEKKVSNLLDLFGCNNPAKDKYAFMYEFIVRTKFDRVIEIRQVTEAMSRKKLVSGQTIYQKIRDIVRRRFPSVDPALLEFTSLVNKLAS